MSEFAAVQSARTGTTPSSRIFAVTADVASASRSLTWQVTHHAAVKSTNTGVPRRRSSSSRTDEYVSHVNGTVRTSGASPDRGNEPSTQSAATMKTTAVT